MQSAPTPTKLGLWSRAKRLNRLFVLCVLLPTTVCTIYYGLIASDVYVSESSFVIRSPEKESGGGLVGTLLQGTGFSHSQDDTYAVKEFISSLDALAVLNKNGGYAKAYSKSDIDLFSRFDALGFDRSQVELLRYYRKHVTVDYDTTSSITNLQVRAFSADEAQRINAELLNLSEQLINRMNDRALQDSVNLAEQEVKNAEEKVKLSAFALSRHRDSQSLFDPERQSALQLQRISSLQDDLSTSRAQLSVLEASAPQNPQIPWLKQHIKSIEAEYDRSSGEVAGSKNSLANRAPGFEQLTLDRSFADKQLSSALASLASARTEAIRQKLYLERVSQPTLPDKAIEPRRFRAILTALVLGLVAWGSLSLLLASIREHRD
jgi:capsular polysaccharide transport system permease protein